MAESHLPRTTPEAVGIPGKAIARLIDRAARELNSLHSFMLLRHGQVAAEFWWHPYAPEHPHLLFSLSKSFTSTAIGLAIADGLLKIDDPVVRFFSREQLPDNISAELQAMTIRHLLTMTSGHSDCALANGNTAKFPSDWAQRILAQPVVHKPGTQFVYNSGATHLLSAIIPAVTGLQLLDYLEPRILVPLGITGARTETSPNGTHIGGWGMSLKTEDIAKFGQLYLQHGRWGDRQLIPAEWVKAATAYQVPCALNDQPDWQQGYGYQFWRARHNAYRGDGAFGQFCLVLPDQDAVIAITAGVQNMQPVLDLIWEELLPNLHTERLSISKSVSIPQPYLPKVAGASASHLAAQLNGRHWKLSENPGRFSHAAFHFDQSGVTLELAAPATTETLIANYGDWSAGQIRLQNDAPRRYAASAGWVKPDELQIHICCYEQPFNIVLQCRFTTDRLTLEMQFNVTWLITWPTVQGELGG